MSVSGNRWVEYREPIDQMAHLLQDPDTTVVTMYKVHASWIDAYGNWQIV